MRETGHPFRAALIEDFARDLRYGARILRRAPGFAAVSIATLALGIGAATAVFSVVNGVLLRPLPFPGADRLVRLFQIDAMGRRYSAVSEPNYLDWKAETRSFAAMTQIAHAPAPVVVGTEAVVTPVALVSREFFEVMGAAPAVGRTFVEDEQRVGGAPAVVVGHRFWTTRLGGAPIDGLTVRVSGEVFQVVGVMPRGFDYPGGSDLWAPRELRPPQTSRTAHNWIVVARVAPGIPIETARAEVSGVSRALKTRYGDGTWMADATAVPLRESLTETARPVLLLLLGAALLLLIIACLNVSNLQLARAAARQREVAVRLAIGAGRGRITRQLLAESLVLTAAAGALGTGLAFGGVGALRILQPPNLPRIPDVRVDAGVLLFALGGAAATAILLALVTSWRTSRPQLREALTEAHGAVASRRGERLRQGLVIGQVAMTIVLLAGAGLLGRSFVALLAVDPGYRTDDALIVDLVADAGDDPAMRRRRMDAQRDIIADLRRLPGVEGVGLVSAFPLGSRFYPNGQFLEMTRPDEFTRWEDVAALGDRAKARAGFAGYRVASEGYFTAMGIPLVRGRLFDERDGPDAPHVAVISESLAKSRWPDGDPIGRYVQFGNMDGDLRGFRIVGIVGDVREQSFERAPAPLFYGYYRQRLVARPSIVVRGSAVHAFAPSVRQIVRRHDPEVALQMRRAAEALDASLGGRRFSLLLVGVFGATALVLATLGVYGLMAYLVTQRTREIGIRLALGADAGSVLRLVVGRGVILASIGIAAGLAAAIASTRFVEGMLFGVTPTDPLAFGGGGLLAATAVALASYLPARRAMRLTPAAALRTE